MQWPFWAALAISGVAVTLVLNSAIFGVVNFAVTLVTVVIVALALRKRPISTVQKILYLQLILLTGLYLLKGLNIAWLSSHDEFKFLSQQFNNRRSLTATDFGTAYQISCFICILLAGFLSLAPTKHNSQSKRLNFNPLILILAILLIFFVSLFVRLSPIGGLPGAVGYVLNHRGTGFAFALLVYMLAIQGNMKLAQRTFMLWLLVAAVMFAIFGSKSYIFLPVVSVFCFYLFAGKLLFPKFLLLFGGFALILMYPIFNIYRSLILGNNEYITDLTDVLLSYRLAGIDGNLFETSALYFNLALDRFVGIEWFLEILNAESSRYLPDSEGIFRNISATNDTMRSIMGLEGVEIGIAPSLIGAAYLAVRDPILTVLLAILFCLLLLLVHSGLVLIFPRLRAVLIAPFCLIIFSIATDGLITSLYWDLPALMLVCSLFNLLVKRDKSISVEPL